MRLSKSSTRSGCRRSGAAPDFALTSQDGAEVTLGEFRGKVVALTFIYASPTAWPPVNTSVPRRPRRSVVSV